MERAISIYRVHDGVKEKSGAGFVNLDYWPQIFDCTAEIGDNAYTAIEKDIAGHGDPDYDFPITGIVNIGPDEFSYETD
jgi:hypothetical protein